MTIVEVRQDDEGGLLEIAHHGLRVLLNDEWWREADMIGFKPLSAAYPADPEAFPERQIFLVRIDDIGPVRRAPGIGIFNDDAFTGMSARERVVMILCGYRLGTLLPPVEVVPTKQTGEFLYKLVNGTHRLYCSLAAGFTHVPAVQGFDLTALDRQ